MPQTQRAFTMMEILVVISIILVLLGLISPALSASRDAALKQSSASNLHQLAVGANVYALDYQEVLPCYWNNEDWLLWADPAVTTYGLPTDSKFPKLLVESLDNYLGRQRSLWFCKADPYVGQVASYGLVNHLYSSYSYVPLPRDYRATTDQQFPVITPISTMDPAHALFSETSWVHGKIHAGYWGPSILMQSFLDGHVAATPMTSIYLHKSPLK